MIGPIVPGVALWRLSTGTDYLVVPGNVGGPELLADVVAAMTPRAMLTPFADLLAARRAGTAVGAFTCYDLETAAAVLRSAASARHRA